MDLSSHPPLPQRQGKAYLWGNPKIIYESAFHNIQYQQKDFSQYLKWFQIEEEEYEFWFDLKIINLGS